MILFLIAVLAILIMLYGFFAWLGDDENAGNSTVLPTSGRRKQSRS